MARQVRNFRDPVGDSAERLDAAAVLKSVLDGFTEREAAVISLRFGLTDGDPKTLDEIGQVFGVTRDRIRQIEQKSLSKLRHPDRSKRLQDYLDTEGVAPLHRLTSKELREQLQQYIDNEIARLHRKQEKYAKKRTARLRRQKERADLMVECGGPQCSERVPQPYNGRPRTYCSDKCRQAAYRIRRNSKVQ